MGYISFASTHWLYSGCIISHQTPEGGDFTRLSGPDSFGFGLVAGWQPCWTLNSEGLASSRQSRQQTLEHAHLFKVQLAVRPNSGAKRQLSC